ncbi:uncharacterized protein LOC125047029 [Penaeus chinensis]|uniref:uncharacterized protein LOC125047029 n=1 Tax=Penaeus chinensis TaxID=139456 RepID=UPI001FB6B934|nr:uncharacterized protein LOC125047029 [Penaeus chinensis]
MVVGPRYMKLKSTIAFRAGLPYKYLFDEEMLKMEESGVIDSIRRRWRKRLPECSLPTNTAMSFEQVSTAFLALMLGGCAAVGLLLGERLASSKRVAALRSIAVSPTSKLRSRWH